MSLCFNVTSLTLLLVALLSGVAAAEAEPEPASTDTKPPSAETKPRETSFAVVPGPFYNPNIGLGINVMPLLMFYPDKSDTISPPSLLMMTGLWAIKPPYDEDPGSRQSAFMVVMSAYINLFQARPTRSWTRRTSERG